MLAAEFEYCLVCAAHLHHPVMRLADPDCPHMPAADLHNPHMPLADVYHPQSPAADVHRPQISLADPHSPQMHAVHAHQIRPRKGLLLARALLASTEGRFGERLLAFKKKPMQQMAVTLMNQQHCHRWKDTNTTCQPEA